MTPPDSGDWEREHMKALKREADRMRVVEIRNDLAQRILAALDVVAYAVPAEEEYRAVYRALAAELRAVVEGR